MTLKQSSVAKISRGRLAENASELAGPMVISLRTAAGEILEADDPADG